MIRQYMISAKPDSFRQELIHSNHFHLEMRPDFLFFFLCKGECRIQYGSNMKRVRENDLFFFPPGAVWQIQSQGQEITLYRLSVSRAYLSDYLPDLAECSLEHFHVTQELNSPVYHEMCRCLSRILFSALFPAPEAHLEELTAVHQLLLCFYREYRDNIHPVTGSTNYIQRRISHILSYVEQHYHEKLLLEDISGELGLHPQYFSLFFKEHFQEKFLDYLNNYRIDRSLSDLINSKKSLLDIAIDHGFQSNKSYAAAFQKHQHELPSVWRKKHQSGTVVNSSERDFLLQSTQYLYTYFRDRAAAAQPAFGGTKSAVALTLDVNLKDVAAFSRDQRRHIICIGNADYLLRNSVYEKLKQVKESCAFTHVYIRNIFSDVMNIYTEPTPDQVIYYWSELDEVVARITGLGFYPVIEIGYTPEQLASKNIHLSYGCHPNMSFPNSLQKWKDLVRAMLLHYKQLYKEELRHWQFDFWNTGNIQSEEGYWGGTQDQFFALYKATWEAFNSVDSHLQLGTPNFSLPDGLSWYEQFLIFCKREGIRPHYFSLHMYSCRDDMKSFKGVFPYSPTTYNYLSLTNTEYIPQLIAQIKAVLKRTGFANLPLIVSEWNVTYYLQDLIRDTAFMATYIATIYLQTIDLIDGIGYFSLTDENGQSRPTTNARPFLGDFGLFSRQGYPKSSYFAFMLLHRLDSSVVQKGDNYIVTRSASGFHVMVINMSDYEKHPDKQSLEHIPYEQRYQVFRETPAVSFRGIIHVIKGSYRITKHTMNRRHGSPYDAWVYMGSPVHTSEEIERAIYCLSHPLLHCREELDTDTILLEEQIEPHGIVLFEVEHLI